MNIVLMTTGNYKYSDVINLDIIVNAFSLAQNYPNPFNPTTTIRFRISDFGFVSLIVYDVLGNKIATLVDEHKPAGSYEIEFSATSSESKLTSGIYIYQLSAGSYSATKKMLMIK